MRLIKLAIISFVFFFLLITAFSLFIPSRVRVFKMINIKADKDSVMAQIKDASKWKNWYPGMDSTKIFYESGVAKGVVLSNKDSVDAPYLHITSEKPDEIIAELEGGKLKRVLSVWKTSQSSTGDSTTLQWYMDFHLRWYPWEKFSSLVFDGTYGRRMERGLLNIKRLLQPEPAN